MAGLGNLSTSITVTIFYVCFLELWRRRFSKPFTIWYYVLVAAAVVRFIVMMPPQNHWESHIAPVGWAIFRNIFLTIQGLGVAFLMWIDSRKAKDRLFLMVQRFNCCVICLHVAGHPVVSSDALVGMMMIPKTVAYMAIAFIGYAYFFKDNKTVNAKLI